MDLTRTVWKRSSYSGSNEGLCVEVATTVPGIIAMRDSKNPSGPALILTPAQWTAFLDDIKKGRVAC